MCQEKSTSQCNCHEGCVSGPLFWSRKKRAQMMKRCMENMQERIEDLKRAIKEIGEG